jgi:hypothetical protein
MDIKAIVLSKVEEALSNWFQRGVTFTESSIWFELFDIPEYNNQPVEVEDTLLDGQREIIFDILKRQGIPPKEWLGCIYDSPINPKRLPLGDMPLSFGSSMRYIPIPIKPLYKTDGMTPRERAKEISKAWYNLTESFWTTVIIQNSKDSTRPLNELRLDKELVEELRLRKAGWSDEDFLIRYAHLEGFTSREVAEFLSRYCNKPSTPGQIRTRRTRLRENEQNFL